MIKAIESEGGSLECHLEVILHHPKYFLPWRLPPPPQSYHFLKKNWVSQLFVSACRAATLGCKILGDF